MKLVYLVSFIIKKFVTMHGHMNVKKNQAMSCNIIFKRGRLSIVVVEKQ